MEKRLNEIRQMFATMEEIKDDRPVVNGDFVVIDFAGSLDGELFEELKAATIIWKLDHRNLFPGLRSN